MPVLIFDCNINKSYVIGLKYVVFTAKLLHSNPSKVVMEEVVEFPDQCKPKSHYREFFDRTVERIANEKGIEKVDHSRAELEYMTKFMENDLTVKEFDELIKRFGENTVCVNCFNGSKALLQDSRIALVAIENDLEYAKDHEPRALYSGQQGKEIHDPLKGDHAPTHATHFNNGLGDNAGWVSRNRKGYVWELSAEGVVPQVDEKKTQRMIFEQYHKILTLQEAKEYSDEINRAIKNYLANALQGTIGDSKTAKLAVSIITKEGTKKSWNYEKTNAIGIEVRQACEKYDQEIGKLVGYAKVHGHDEKTDRKLARTVTNLCNTMNVDVGNFYSLLGKILRMK